MILLKVSIQLLTNYQLTYQVLRIQRHYSIYYKNVLRLTEIRLTNIVQHVIEPKFVGFLYYGWGLAMDWKDSPYLRSMEKARFELADTLIIYSCTPYFTNATDRRAITSIYEVSKRVQNRELNYAECTAQVSCFF